MRAAQFSVRRPVTTAMTYVGLIVLGLFSLSLLALDIMPDLEIPTLTVIASYEGAGPKEVEKRIVKPLETSLSTVPHIKHVLSVAREGAALITLQYEWGTDIDEASNDVRTQISLTKKYLPEAAEEPVVFKFDMSKLPVVMIGATAEQSLPRLRQILEDQVVDRLKRVPGVAAASIRGGDEREIRVELNRERMVAYGVTVDRVLGALRMGNLSLPGGHIQTDARDFLLRVPAEFGSLDEIRQLVVGGGASLDPRMAALAPSMATAASRSGALPLVRVKDIARVVDGSKQVTRQVRINGKPGAIVMLMKQSGANTVDVVERAIALIDEMQARVPEDVELVLLRDGSRFIKGAISNIWQAVLYGGVLVLFVMLLFLRSLRSAAVVAVSIPTSLIVAFLLMYVGGYTLNMVSLSSLAIAIGMVVDNSIVVLDNIFRHRQRGVRADVAAVHGSGEVGSAVVASTLTTVVIFLPVLFVGGIMGMMFKQLAAIVTLTLAASLFVSLTLVPLVASRLLAAERKPEGPLAQKVGAGFTWLEQSYGALLRRAVAKPLGIMLGGALLFAGSLGLAALVGVEFMPRMDDGQFDINLRLPVGTPSEVTGTMALELDRLVAEQVPERLGTTTSWGYGSEGLQAFLGGEEGSQIARVSTMLKAQKDRQRSNLEVAQALEPLYADLAGATTEARAASPIQALLFGGGKPIVVEVSGYDLDLAADLARLVRDRLAQIPGIADVDISRREGQPELRVDIDREKAAALGVAPAQVALAVNQALAGTLATQYRSGSDEIDLRLRLQESERSSADDVAQLLVASPGGGRLRVGNIARIEPGFGPTAIERKNQQRVIYVKADIRGRDLGSVAGEVQAAIDGVALPPGFHLALTGEREEQLEAFRLMALAFVLGIMLVYMVMAAIFESLVLPFIILFTIPFAIVGVIWGFVLSGQTLSLTSSIGVLILVGIAVNNGIVLIDFMNLLRARGYSVTEAVAEGGRSRLRPVLMTAITTIAGMVPLTVATGEGSETWVGMGIAVIGGLFASTVVTLLFVPTLYSLIEGWRQQRRERATPASEPRIAGDPA